MSALLPLSHALNAVELNAAAEALSERAPDAAPLIAVLLPHAIAFDVAASDFEAAARLLRLTPPLN